MKELDHPQTTEITSTPEGMRVWQQERVIIEVTERICELMEEQGVSRATLAERLGKSRGYVTQILSGSANLTLRTISDVFWALGRQFHPSDGPEHRCSPCAAALELAVDNPEMHLPMQE